MSPTAAAAVTAPSVEELRALRQAILDGSRELSRDEARAMLEIAPGTPAWEELLAGARAIRERFVGRIVKVCSILNAKAGNCSEDCSFCSQSRVSENVDYKKTKWLTEDDIVNAARSAAANGAGALGIVAAWHGVKEGAQLEMVCKAIKRLAEEDGIRADANLGILATQTVADRLKDAGCKVYGHNLETARSHFDTVCSTHGFDERWQTIEYVKKSGMKLCSGGIIGLGEDKDQRIEFAEQLRFIEPDMIPINFLNPLDGTALKDRPTVPCDEALATLAVLRWFLPTRNLMVAGGKEVTFGDRIAEVFDAGVNSVMVGNYLTTLGTSPEQWRDIIRAKGLIVRDAGPEELGAKPGCGSGGCGCS